MVRLLYVRLISTAEAFPRTARASTLFLVTLYTQITSGEIILSTLLLVPLLYAAYTVYNRCETCGGLVLFVLQLLHRSDQSQALSL